MTVNGSNIPDTQKQSTRHRVSFWGGGMSIVKIRYAVQTYSWAAKSSGHVKLWWSLRLVTKCEQLTDTDNCSEPLSINRYVEGRLWIILTAVYEGNHDLTFIVRIFIYCNDDRLACGKDVPQQSRVLLLSSSVFVRLHNQWVTFYYTLIARNTRVSYAPRFDIKRTYSDLESNSNICIMKYSHKLTSPSMIHYDSSEMSEF